MNISEKRYYLYTKTMKILESILNELDGEEVDRKITLEIEDIKAGLYFSRTIKGQERINHLETILKKAEALREKIDALGESGRSPANI